MRVRRLAGSTAASGAVLALAGACVAPPTAAGFTTRVIASGGVNSKPDDITELDNQLYVSFQNGVGPAGQPAPGGRRTSTIARFTLAGKPTGSWKLPGKCDGLTTDPANHRLIATVNEDGNSSLYTVAPATGSVRHYTYKTLTHGGGTDSISIVAGQIFVAASAPTPAADGTTFTKPALYKLTLTGTTATTTSVLAGNAIATDAVTGTASTLNLSDPDSTETVPAGAARFAGDLLLDSQGDSQQVYLTKPGTTGQKATVLNLGTQVNDTAFVTARTGTLYVTDNANNTLDAITGRFTPGQAMVAAPQDSTVSGFVGRLDLRTGHIAPFAVGFANPAGLLFVPGH